jgi:hypothetical protein
MKTPPLTVHWKTNGKQASNASGPVCDHQRNTFADREREGVVRHGRTLMLEAL